MNLDSRIAAQSNLCGGLSGISNGQRGAEQPTRFSQCASRLDARTGHIAALIDRASRVADRLGGGVPQPCEDKKFASGDGCIAAQLERALDDIDALTSRFDSVLQRLESL